ncbi:hypothetical protein AAFF_G00352380 [Aldrovandia affinis]|uniref:Uncharacterized protein n=1 Tax=Aldrovandia affinis TaxID=143900 RepID=A0AAD7WND8_9TELE|nr:hypothetical protein AAFF_G00352380 [Aldrovandia affinis]
MPQRAEERWIVGSHMPAAEGLSGPAVSDKSTLPRNLQRHNDSLRKTPVRKECVYLKNMGTLAWPRSLSGLPKNPPSEIPLATVRGPSPFHRSLEDKRCEAIRPHRSVHFVAYGGTLITKLLGSPFQSCHDSGRHALGKCYKQRWLFCAAAGSWESRVQAHRWYPKGISCRLCLVSDYLEGTVGVQWAGITGTMGVVPVAYWSGGGAPLR